MRRDFSEIEQSGSTWGINKGQGAQTSVNRERIAASDGIDQRDQQQQAMAAQHRTLLRRLRRQTVRHADAGRLGEALVCQQQVIALVPDDPHEFMQLGFLHRQADQLDDATHAFESALKLAPAEPDPHEALAEIYLDTSRYDDAVRESKVVLKLVPQSVPARQILSAAYFQMGQMEKALDVTQEMVRLAPLDPISHYKNGMLHHQHGNWRLALDEFTTVTRMSADGSIEHEEAESAIEALDRQQINIILTLAADDRLFQLRLARNPVEAAQERGFYLSFDASMYVQHLAIEHGRDPEMFGPSLLERPSLYN
jgi:regulator of sirC expression with transglutaminase-like and TPR domain